jgi:hypothetical protein
MVWIRRICFLNGDWQDFGSEVGQMKDVLQHPSHNDPTQHIKNGPDDPITTIN